MADSANGGHGPVVTVTEPMEPGSPPVGNLDGVFP